MTDEPITPPVGPLAASDASFDTPDAPAIVTPAEPHPAASAAATATTTPTATAAATSTMSEAVLKFRSCRWRRPPDEGVECCGHRDVLPMAGTTSFDPEAWCPDCAYFKLRRVPKKREYY